MSALAETAASRMGTSAGEKFRDTGVPSKNPLEGKEPTLAAAWRRAYMAAAKPKTMRGR